MTVFPQLSKSSSHSHSTQPDFRAQSAGINIRLKLQASLAPKNFFSSLFSQLSFLPVLLRVNWENKMVGEGYFTPGDGAHSQYSHIHTVSTHAIS